MSKSDVVFWCIIICAITIAGSCGHQEPKCISAIAEVVK